MPYILNTDKDRREMLQTIGLDSFDGLFRQLPDGIRLKEPLDIPVGLDERETKKSLEALAGKNTPIDGYNSFLGAGCYDHYIPAALPAILSRSEFVTAYTPYQAEASQGALQAIYEYQSYICYLTGMDVTNASMFDGASAMAEAALMALRITGRNKIVVSGSIHPEYRQTIETYLSGFDFKIKNAGFGEDGLVDRGRLAECLDAQTACLIVQSPNFFGLIEDAGKIGEAVKSKGALFIVVADPLSFTILKDAASLGADIFCGDGQPLGGALNFGGPSFGILATKNEYLRQLPGRIVGRTVDCRGKQAFCLTMQAREQHIRREKATSNICSNQSLNAIGAAVYLALMGKKGVTNAALSSFEAAHYLYQRLKSIEKIKMRFSPRFFNEFAWEIEEAKKIIKKLYRKKIIAGFYLGEFYPRLKNCILSCCTEKKTKADIDDFVEALMSIL